MTLFHQAAPAVLLVVLTLLLQCAGVAALIEWARRTILRKAHKFGLIYSASQVVKSTVGIIDPSAVVPCEQDAVSSRWARTPGEAAPSHRRIQRPVMRVTDKP